MFTLKLQEGHMLNTSNRGWPVNEDVSTKAEGRATWPLDLKPDGSDHAQPTEGTKAISGREGVEGYQKLSGASFRGSPSNC